MRVRCLSCVGVTSERAKLSPDPQDLPTARLVISTLVDQLKKSQREIEQLKHRLDVLCRRLYGRKSEKVDPSQLSLLLEGLEPQASDQGQPAEPAVSVEPKARRSPGRRRLPQDLPRRRVVLEPAEEERTCACGTAKVKIGEEVSEKLDFVPASFEVVETVRPCLACPKCHEGVTVAKAPAQAVEKGLAGEGLLAHVVVSKYADHLPLNRLERIYGRQGVELSRSTLCDFVAAASRALEPLGEELRRQVLASTYVQTDDTPVTVLVEEGGRFTGRLWVYLDPIGKQVAFDATQTRERDGPQVYLGSYRGHLQADAYSGYDALFRGGGMIELGCWAHTRRRFVEALPTDARAATFVALIGELYAVERDGAELDFCALRELRRQRSLPVLDRIRETRDSLTNVVLPKSPLGEALAYMTNQWVALGRYVEDGRFSIDNNAAERQLRAVAVGRKNWLFMGSMEGAHRAALMYSIVQSCRLARIDPWVYIRDVLVRVATHPHRRIAELLPKAWAETLAVSAAA